MLGARTRAIALVAPDEDAGAPTVRDVELTVLENALDDRGVEHDHQTEIQLPPRRLEDLARHRERDPRKERRGGSHARC